jgi:stage V sporulation protein S
LCLRAINGLKIHTIHSTLNVKNIATSSLLKFAREEVIMNVIKVSGTSRTSAVAGAIAGVFRENQRAEVQAIGAIAVNQAVKALALAKSYLKEDGYEILFTPEFVDVEIDGKVRTAIKFVIETR